MGELTFKPGDVVTWEPLNDLAVATAEVLRLRLDGSLRVGFTVFSDGDVVPSKVWLPREGWHRTRLRHATPEERQRLMEALWMS